MRSLIALSLVAGVMVVTLRAQSEESGLDVRTYEKGHWGFTSAIPDSWTVYREADVPEEFRVSFGMPKVWSEKEKQHIENSVSISVYRMDSLKNTEDVARLEHERTADILVVRSDLKVENGIAFDKRTRIDGLEYVSRTTCRYENGLGYVLSFTATDGTFALNLPVFEDFIREFSFQLPSEPPQQLVDRSYYDLAREYYKFGPGKAKKVIAALQKHLELNKDDEKAFILLAVTQKGVGLLDDALRSCDEVERIGWLNKSITPKVYLIQAECYLYKKELQRAQEILQSKWAFFQDDSKYNAEYDRLMSAITAAIKSSGKAELPSDPAEKSADD